MWAHNRTRRLAKCLWSAVTELIWIWCREVSFFSSTQYTTVCFMIHMICACRWGLAEKSWASDFSRRKRAVWQWRQLINSEQYVSTSTLVLQYVFNHTGATKPNINPGSTYNYKGNNPFENIHKTLTLLNHHSFQHHRSGRCIDAGGFYWIAGHICIETT